MKKDPGMDRVLGVDPGLSETGWAVLEGPGSRQARLVASGCIRTSPRTPLPLRLREIHGEVARLLRAHRPGHMAVEEMFFLKAAHTIRATLQARGVVLLAASQSGTPVTEYNPRQVKISLTGSGNAAKPQMQRMVQAALGLADRLTPDDVADAAAIALCQLRSSRLKSLVVLDRVGGRKA
ncbi:MAG: crossover junction endodeoxyribonuclease RuvC [Elusimicrobiota bacterium]